MRWTAKNNDTSFTKSYYLEDPSFKYDCQTFHFSVVLLDNIVQTFAYKKCRISVKMVLVNKKDRRFGVWLVCYEKVTDMNLQPVSFHSLVQEKIHLWNVKRNWETKH